MPILVIVSMLAYFCFLEQLLVSLITLHAVQSVALMSWNFCNFLVPKKDNIIIFIQVGKMGTGAVVISLPFSCVLGLLSSMTSATMGKLSKFPKETYIRQLIL